LPTECVLNFREVMGKCHVAFSENVDIPMAEWTVRGPYRFYFSQAYNGIKQTFEEPPFHATNIGMQGMVRWCLILHQPVLERCMCSGFVL
jgi:hypothetical protein